MGRRKKRKPQANSGTPSVPKVSGAKKRQLRLEAEHKLPANTMANWQAGKIKPGILKAAHASQHKSIVQAKERKKTYRLTGANRVDYTFGPVADAPKNRKRKKKL